MKKLPYGISDYEKLIEENYYYVDKTKYIEKLENLAERYIMFLRPRKFGKTLFTSVLENYYDINKKDKFEKLFGETYIGKNPSKFRNSYYILRFNFSGIDTNGEETTILSFKREVTSSINVFVKRYGLDGNIRIEHRVSLRSELLRLHGICDAMLFKDDQPMAIVEFKSRVKTKLNMGEIIQMAAYSMICEVEFGRQFSFGYILSGDKGKVKPVSINPEIKLKVLQVRDALIAQCEECLLPDSSASILQCGQCEYLNFCADRL